MSVAFVLLLSLFFFFFGVYFYKKKKFFQKIDLFFFSFFSFLLSSSKIHKNVLFLDREYLDKFKGRLDLIDYAESMDIPVGATKEFSYSEDENSFHISYESGELEDPSYPGISFSFFNTMVLLNSCINVY